MISMHAVSNMVGFTPIKDKPIWRRYYDLSVYEHQKAERIAEVMELNQREIATLSSLNEVGMLRGVRKRQTKLRNELTMCRRNANRFEARYYEEEFEENKVMHAVETVNQMIDNTEMGMSRLQGQIDDSEFLLRSVSWIPTMEHIVAEEVKLNERRHQDIVSARVRLEYLRESMAYLENLKDSSDYDAGIGNTDEDSS